MLVVFQASTLMFAGVGGWRTPCKTEHAQNAALPGRAREYAVEAPNGSM